MSMLSQMQTVDIVALQSNSVQNNFVGVSLYVDDKGVSKGSPSNRRATSLCAAVGLSLDVRGDAFVARCYEDNKDEYRRIDFKLSECDSNAAWVQEAKLFNQKKQDGLVEDGKIVNKIIQCANLGCYEEGKLRCSACKKVRYCTPTCQKIAWKRHKLD
eukprot:Awhi_evm1s15169